jgi:hypothetical protein
LNPAIQHVDDSIGLLGQSIVMGDNHQRGPVLVQSFEQIQNLPPGSHVELTSGLVGQEERWPVGQCSRYGNPLHFTSGELGSSVPHAIGQSYIAQQLGGARSPEVTGKAGLCHRELHIFLRGQHR